MQPDRDSLEQVAQLVTGSDSEFEELTDRELTDLIEDQLHQEESVGSPVDPGEVPVPTAPTSPVSSPLRTTTSAPWASLTMSGLCPSRPQWPPATLPLMPSAVPDGSFFYDPVLWAMQNGVTAGLTPTTFGPNAICNRAQVVTFLYRTFS